MRRQLTVLCLSTLVAAPAALALPATAAPKADRAAAAAPSVPGELVVGYVEGASPVERDRARSRAAGKKKERVVAARGATSEVEVVEVPVGDLDIAITQLEADPAVAYAEPNWVHTVQGVLVSPKAKPGSGTAPDPVDYYVNGSLWGMYGDASTPANTFGSQAAEAWVPDPKVLGDTPSIGSRSVYVGVIDEGIQVSHPDLDDNTWTNPYDPIDGLDNDGNGYVDDVNGWDFAGKNSTVYDGGSRGSSDDHGTHVAGTIGAEHGDELGVKGVNHQVTMISGKFLGPRGGSLADAVKAVDYFTDLKTRHGMNIVATNNSWGGGAYSQALMDAIGRANAQNILFIAAAGNSGTNNDTTASYPSGYDVPNVIAVAAIDRTGGLAGFSQYGAASVDLGAPGVDVWSTTTFDTYSTYNGTSMATPHVTGAAALYAASHPGSSSATIKAAILRNAVATSSLSRKTVTGGRLNASSF
jgi:subtilisin family serine protease